SWMRMPGPAMQPRGSDGGDVAARGGEVRWSAGRGGWRIHECRGVLPRIDVVFASISVLARHQQGVAAHSRRSRRDAIDGDGLTIIQRQDPVHGPPAK